MRDIADKLIKLNKNIVLIYAFNGTGKTRLSVAYKDATKQQNKGNHSGVYYNAYSEDLFVWDNDEDNDGVDIKLNIIKSNLNKYHSELNEEKIQDKLLPYKPRFDFKFNSYENVEEGVKSISFYLKKENDDNIPSEIDKELLPIKISRGEQQVFIWCFFLALFDVEIWTGRGRQSSHFFIDDPVSSLDDNNIFITISSLMDLIERHHKERKIIITTHHIGFFSILADWLTRGEKSQKYESQVDIYKLKKSNGIVELLGPRKEVFLSHLELLRVLKQAIDEDKIYVYNFALLRQILENISSFLGAGNFSYVLTQIGFNDEDKKAQLINIMSHKTVFRYEMREPVPDNKEDIITIFEAIQKKYQFKL
ncbi:MAG: AAA family ATPase [Dysgonamonadaceae bacterium]|nr:AAA family ATPase [Dysgonamonadaceae bacterium]